jgi:PAS domain S-box-containing protein
MAKPDDSAADRRRKTIQFPGKEKASSAANSASMPQEEKGRLQEELRAHQIELEMQNEELRRAQVELDVIRARYFDLYDLAPVGYCSVSGEGTILEANLRSGELLGIPRGEMLKHPFSQFIVREDQDIYYFHRKLLAETGRRSFELRMRRRDGTIFWTQLVMTHEPESSGAPVCWTVIVDITERKQAELALRDKEAELQTIFENAPVSMFILDKEGRIVRANALARLFNVARSRDVPENLHGRVLGCFRPREPGAASDRPVCKDCSVEGCAIERLVATSFQNGQSCQQAEVTHSVMVGAEEQILKLQVSTAKIMVGSRPMVALAIQDVTQQKLMEERFRQTQKMESLGVLAGGVAHDMNNVLGAILGLASSNLSTQPTDSSTYRAFEIISQAAARGAVTVKSLLSFARNSPEIEEVLDLNGIVLEVSRLLEHVTQSRVRVNVDLADTLKPIRGDGGALGSALMNLFVNAFDAIPSQGVITLRTRNVDDLWVEISVEDTGTGMTEEVRKKAVDPFFTTKEIGKGTGLGLSTSLNTVRCHRGTMEIESEPGRGTKIHLRFPVWTGFVSQHATAVNPPERFANALTVLVVDDDAQVQDAMREILHVLGHRPSSALSGKEALAQMEGGLDPDVVILDMNMPELGGAEILPLLRKAKPGVPVILSTGRDDDTVRDLSIAYRDVRVLGKPYEIKQLIYELNRIKPRGRDNSTIQ